MKTLIILLIIIALGVVAYYAMPSLAALLTRLQSSARSTVSVPYHATLETSQGAIGLAFYPDAAPKIVENFIKLAKQGFYNGLSFHRVIPGFMIQGGDPNCATKDGEDDKGACGAGGPGYQLPDEIDAASALYKTGYKKGVVAMANSGPNTNGSQFFIMVADYPLPPNYTIFGYVTSGQDVADAISNVERNRNDRPLEVVVMKSVTIAE